MMIPIAATTPSPAPGTVLRSQSVPATADGTIFTIY